jgi:hypothetical protein
VSHAVSLENALCGHHHHCLPQKPSPARVDLALHDPQTNRRAFLGLKVSLTPQRRPNCPHEAYDVRLMVGLALTSVCLMAMPSRSCSCVFDFAAHTAQHAPSLPASLVTSRICGYDFTCAGPVIGSCPSILTPDLLCYEAAGC